MKFQFNKAEDESMDSEHVLLHDDGKPTGFAVQDGRSYGGGYTVTEHTGSGDSLAVTFHGSYRSLKKAKEAAIAKVPKCRAFLMCDNAATTTIPNPILGDVPCCDRCSKKMAALR